MTMPEELRVLTLCSETLRILLFRCAGGGNCSLALSRLGELWGLIVANGCDGAETEEIAISWLSLMKKQSNSGKRLGTLVVTVTPEILLSDCADKGNCSLAFEQLGELWELIISLELLVAQCDRELPEGTNTGILLGLVLDSLGGIQARLYT